jgi:hypothetical protein
MADKVDIIEPTKDYLLPLEEHEDGVSQGISVINTAEINQQIATAHRYPRSITAFRRKVYEMVTLDVETAESCIYAIPRDGKIIDGPSIRFAEILLVGWGNYRAATEPLPVSPGDRFITAKGMFFDLETNGAVEAKTLRRIVGKVTKEHPNGKPFGDDMIATTGNAAASIALRNAITRGIPKALWKELFDEAKKVAGGSAQTFATRRDKVIKELGIQGATPDQIFQLLGVKGVDDLQTEHLVHLRGLQNAIKDGELTVDEVFSPQLKPGEAAPPRPRESEFKRETPQQTTEKAAGAEASKGDQPQQQASEPAQQAAAADVAVDDAKAAREQERLDWIKDAHTALAGTAKVKEVTKLQEETKDAGVMTDAEEADWDKACGDKVQSIMDAAKAARKPK